VKDADSAAKEAKRIGYPVVLKGLSKSIIHKTDIGAVETSIGNEEQLRKAFDRIAKNVKKKAKKSPESYLVQREASGTEIIIGMKRDPQFGPVVMFGLGGVFVEVLKDVSFRVAPLEEKDCLEMIDEIKGKPVLEGARGKKKANTKAIAKILMAVSSLAEKNRQIAEIDLNPIMVDSKSALIVDARMMEE
jgi:acyl-CoA synthetase (NDP forming)